MRAAVLEVHGQPPSAGEFAEPEAGEEQAVVEVLAAGLNPVDLAIASGAFYGGAPPLPSVVGREGVARLPDGTRAYFESAVAPYGSMAERAPIELAAAIPLPEGLDSRWRSSASRSRRLPRPGSARAPRRGASSS